MSWSVHLLTSYVMILIQATVAQIKALELEKKIQADRRRKSKEDERFVAQQLIKVRRSGSRLVQRHSCVTHCCNCFGF